MNSSIISYVYDICRPHPHVIKDESQREIAMRRNIGILSSELACFACLLLYIAITNGTPNSVQKGSLVTIIGVITVFLTCCRSYPNLFLSLYFLLVTLFGPVFHYCYKDSIFFNSLGVIVLPTWALCVSGSKAFFIVQLVIQNVYLHILYKPQMLMVLNTMQHEAYFQRMSSITTFGVFVNAIFVFITEIGLQKAHHKIIQTENKKFQLERQKIFFVSFSHEIRNLISSVIGNVSLCMLESVPPKVQILLRNSQVCGEVLHHLLTNILDAGKLQFGGLEIFLNSHVMSEVWVKIWSICSQLIAQKGLQGVIRLKKNVPQNLKIDSHRLMQVFLNLVGNAIKFTEKGSISIDIQWTENESFVTDHSFSPCPYPEDDQDEGVFEKNLDLDIVNNNLLISNLDLKKISKERFETRCKDSNKGILRIIITDTGCGISELKISEIFDQFSQVHESVSKRQLGTGLGLFITREIINKMKGEIKVFSKVGKGSAFVVCIPTESSSEG